MSSRRWVWWAAGAAALLAAAAVAGVRADRADRSTAFALGGVLGSALFGLVVATLVHGLWSFSGRGRGLSGPWILGLAACVALIANVVRGFDEEQERRACDEPARPAVRLVTGLPTGITSIAADPNDVPPVRRIISAIDAERVSARAIVREEDEPVGFLVVIEHDEPNALDDVVRGLEDQSGRSTVPVEFGRGGEGRMLETADGGAALIAESDPCALAILFAVSPRAGRQIASGLRI